MPIKIDVQQWDLLSDIPEPAQVEVLINDVMELIKVNRSYSCSIRVVDEAESAEFNERYRNKQGPTNVLSFPYEPFAGVETDLLGDLLICAPLVMAEAEAQGKALEMHFSHLVVHGVLHLFGYDHQTADEAEEMESLEIQVMQQHGFTNPYNDIPA